MVILSSVGVHTGEGWAATKEQSVSVQTCELPDWSTYNKWFDIIIIIIMLLLKHLIIKKKKNRKGGKTFKKRFIFS